MPGNVLKAIITADSKGLQSATGKATGSIEEMRQVVKSLKAELAGLNTAQLNSKGGKVLAAEFKSATSELKGLEQQANLAKGATTNFAQAAFTGLRKVALVLPGIGFAGLVGGIVEFGLQLAGVGQKVDATTKKVKELVKSIGETITQTAAETTGEAAKVQALTTVVLDQTKSYKQRNNALSELKEINKSYFGDLTLEASKLALLKTRADEYTKAIIQQAVIKEFSDQIAKLSVEQAKNNVELTKGVLTVNKYKQALKEAGQINKQVIGGGGTGGANLGGGEIPVSAQLNEANKVLQKTQSNADAIRSQLGLLNTELTKAIEKSLEFRPLSDKAAKEAAKGADSIIEQAKRLAAFLDKNTQFSVVFDVDPRDSQATTFKKAVEFIQKTKEFFDKNSSRLGVFDFKASVAADFKFIPKPGFFENIKEQAGIEATKTFKQVKKEFEDNIKRLAENDAFIINANAAMKPLKREDVLEKGGKVFINPVFDNTTLQERLKIALANINEQFIKIADNFQQAIGSAIGDGLGEALSGGGFGALFKGIFNAVGGAMQSLGQALLATAIGLKAIKAAFKTLNPAVALAAGVGLIALGAVIKNTVGNIGFRAAGGPVQAGKSFIVGEKGPELFVPNTGGSIVSNRDLFSSGRGISAGQAQVQVAGTFRIEGKDLIAAIALNNASQRRLG